LSDAEKAAALRQQARRARSISPGCRRLSAKHARRDMASLIAILVRSTATHRAEASGHLPLVRDALESMKDTVNTAS
jgi:hypothetical protein